jgi:hypothetical protein
MTPTDSLARVHALADQATMAGYVVMVLCGLGVLATVWMLVDTWRRWQRIEAARRVRDRLAQEADPEGWARRQAQQAEEEALIAAELAAMHRARWYGRLWGWRRRRLWPQP